MKIIAHRGYWKDISEENSEAAFKRACSLGFGIETDVRDYNGTVVISHDIASDGAMTLEKFLQIYKEAQPMPHHLALNIKSDGLAHLIETALKRYQVKDYFVFDMSIPDLLQYVHKGLNCFTRQSEYEPEPALIEKTDGVWLDEFCGHWITDDVLSKYLDSGKKVCIVSPELHKRGYEQEWRHYLKFIGRNDSESIMLCTDYPEEARRVFYGQ